MTTNFPAGLDALQNPQPETKTRSLNPLLRHARQHQDINDAVEALQAKVGVDGSAVLTSLDNRVDTAESDIDAVEADVTTLDGQMATANSNITTNATDIDTLELTPHNQAIIPSAWETISRLDVSNSLAVLTSQGLRMAYFTAKTTGTITNVGFLVNQAAAATPTIARIGLYSIAGNGDGTLIASTTNDTALFSTLGIITKALTASVGVTRGNRYAIGALVVTAVATPALMGLVNDQNLLALAPRLTGFLSGQADLPASFTAASLSTTGTMLWFRMT